jgi:hypothetical protein
MIRSLALGLALVMALSAAVAGTPAGRSLLQPVPSAQLEPVTLVPDSPAALPSPAVPSTAAATKPAAPGATAVPARPARRVTPRRVEVRPSVAPHPVPPRPAGSPRAARAGMSRPATAPSPAAVPPAAIATVLQNLPQVFQGDEEPANGGAPATPCGMLPAGPVVQGICDVALSGALSRTH